MATTTTSLVHTVCNAFADVVECTSLRFGGYATTHSEQEKRCMEAVLCAIAVDALLLNDTAVARTHLLAHALLNEDHVRLNFLSTCINADLTFEADKLVCCHCLSCV